MKLTELDTPCLILDRGIMEHNIVHMDQRILAKGLTLRPHLKTAKNAEIARLAVKNHFGGITISTLNEAAYFTEHGFTDMLYAVCISPQKLPRVARLQEKGCRITLITDSIEVARAINAEAQQGKANFHVLIEIDCGESRTGITPEDPKLLEIARILDGTPAVCLDGVITHAGHSYACRTREAITAVAQKETEAARAAAERLRSSGFSCPALSVGSTPTALHGEEMAGITEVRAGVYMFGDLFQSEVFSCSRGDIALSVLATVISHNRAKNRFVIDAGALALSKDRSTRDTAHDVGYGLVGDSAGRIAEPTMIVTDVHQEHGEVTGNGPIPFERFPIGTLVRVFPNHACMTAAMFARYHVLENGEEIGAIWERTNGWS